MNTQDVCAKAMRLRNEVAELGEIEKVVVAEKEETPDRSYTVSISTDDGSEDWETAEINVDRATWMKAVKLLKAYQDKEFNAAYKDLLEEIG